MEFSSQQAPLLAGEGPAAGAAAPAPSLRLSGRASQSSPLLADEAPAAQPMARILDRASVYHQSRGGWNIQRVGGAWRKLYYNDVFHTLVNAPTRRLVVLCGAAYMAAFIGFAFLYQIMGTACELECTNFTRALYFSVEVMMTIGFGAPGKSGPSAIFFSDCLMPLAVIIAQSLVGIFLDSLCIGLVFQRFSRAQTRASTIVFTDKAVMRRIRGEYYLCLQVAELRKHQLVEAHVRLYAVRREREEASGATYVQSFAMRLSHPDDELGAMLLMAMPQVIVHRVDAWSPLAPVAPGRPGKGAPFRGFAFPDILQRAADADVGSRDAHECEVCGETFFSAKHLRRHQIYSARDDVVSGHSSAAVACGACGEAFSSAANLARHQAHEGHEGSAAEGEAKDEDEDGVPRSHAHMALDGGGEGVGGGASEAEMQAFLADRRVEIVVLVEGIDAATSCTLQARHSYTWEDIAWNHTFANCTLERPDGGVTIDFARFHDLEPAGEGSRVTSVS